MQNIEVQEDLRVQRTRTLLQEALMALVVEKGFADITVSDITARARVNRSTFYRHYLDKYALLDEYMDEVYAITNTDEIEHGVDGPFTLIRHIQKFADFYRVMLGQNGDARFTQRFQENTRRNFRRMLENQPPQAHTPEMPPLEMRLNYAACAGIGGIMWWLENGQPCSPEQLASWLSKLSTTGVGLGFPLLKVPDGN